MPHHPHAHLAMRACPPATRGRHSSLLSSPLGGHPAPKKCPLPSKSDAPAQSLILADLFPRPAPEPTRPLHFCTIFPRRSHLHWQRCRCPPLARQQAMLSLLSDIKCTPARSCNKSCCTQSGRRKNNLARRTGSTTTVVTLRCTLHCDKLKASPQTTPSGCRGCARERKQLCTVDCRATGVADITPNSAAGSCSKAVLPEALVENLST